MGFALGGNTRFLHAWERCRRADSDTGVGNDSSARPRVRDKRNRLRPPGMLAVNPTSVACSDIGRQYWMGVFPDTTIVVIAGNTADDVRVSQNSG